MDFAIWNTLHDGSIESIQGAVPGDVTITIDIIYLCEKLPTAETRLLVRLWKCTRLEFEPFDGGAITDFAELGMRDIEILSASLKDDIVRIVCTDGLLNLCYDRAASYLMDGTFVSQADLEAAAKRYWTEWSLKNSQK